MNRTPVVAGQFYARQKEQWLSEVNGYLKTGRETQQKIILAMLPHAGHVFSGSVAGQTLARAELASKDNHAPRVLLLGPNHSGQGKKLALWPSGHWLLPGAELAVDKDLAQDLLDGCALLEADTQAHLYEHSLEVILPFLWAKNDQTKIVPLCVAEPNLDKLLQVGQDLAKILSNYSLPVTIIVSSDMSHFIPKDLAQRKDKLALEAILDIDPEKLYHQVRKHDISMCGILPMTIGLTAAKSLGASDAQLVAYNTSGDVTGDYDQVVSYAGVLIS